MPNNYSPLAVANTFIDKFSNEDSYGLTHMKLQKLVYCVHGWWLSSEQDALLNEKPQVWKYGPVFNSMYHVLSLHGNAPIKFKQSEAPFCDPKTVDENPKAMKIIEWVWQRYGHLSAITLSNLTHRKGSAWEKIVSQENYEVRRGTFIPDNLVKDEFNKVFEEEKPV